jgi:hypothetical protein
MAKFTTTSQMVCGSLNVPRNIIGENNIVLVDSDFENS